MHECYIIRYGAYISRVFNFANFELLRKFISAKILTAMVRYMSSAHVREIISTKISKNSNSRKIRPAKYKRHTVKHFFPRPLFLGTTDELME